MQLHHIEKGCGQAVILLHGGMGDVSSWAQTMDALAASFRVIAYSRRHSHPNHNELRGAHALRHDVDDLLALLGRLGIESAHLVGTSYGAVVALAFALAHTSRVSSLVMAEPPLHGWARRTAEGTRLYSAFIEEVWKPASLAFDQGDEHAAVQRLTDGIWGRRVFEHWPSSRQAAALRNAPAMKLLVQSPDPFPALSRREVGALTLPTLLIQGEHTSALHRRVNDEVARVMTQAASVEITGAGHGSAQENPKDFSAAVLAFLKAIPASNGIAQAHQATS